MQTALFKVKLKNPRDPINLYFITDTHIGHINHDIKKLKKIKTIVMEDPYAQVIFGGDNTDGRMPDHKFFNLENIDPKIKTSRFMSNCYEVFEDLVIDLSPKVLGIHIGNHELKVNRVAPYIENICKRRQCTFLGYRALSILTTDSTHKGSCRQYKIFSSHGSGGGRKSGAKVNRIEEEAKSNKCQIFLQGHTHYLSCTQSIMHEPYYRNGKVIINEVPQIFVNGGGFLKSYQVGNYSYAEKSSYQPQPTGCAKIEINPYYNTFKGSIIT